MDKTLNYKCFCGGQFNEPEINDARQRSKMKYYCPFCGKEMIGLRGKMKEVD